MIGKSVAARAFVLTQFVLFAIYALVFALMPFTVNTVTLIIGAGLIALGFAVFALAVNAHAATNANTPNISPEPKDATELVQRGIYRNVRHPIYTAVLLCFIGASVVHGSLIVWSVALILVAFFTVKSMFEESLLRQTYTEYAAYMQRTGRFLPLVFNLTT